MDLLLAVSVLAVCPKRQAQHRVLPAVTIPSINSLHAAHVQFEVQTDTEGTSTAEPQLLVKLWRADMLSGSLELSTKSEVQRADAGAGLLLGAPQAQLQQQPIAK